MADQEGLMWEGFVEKWWTEHGESPVPPNQLWKLAVNNDMSDSVLGDGNERSQKTRFGIEMRKQQDRIYGNFRLCGKRDNHRKTMIYWLVKMEK